MNACTTYFMSRKYTWSAAITSTNPVVSATVRKVAGIKKRRFAVNGTCSTAAVASNTPSDGMYPWNPDHTLTIGSTARGKYTFVAIAAPSTIEVVAITTDVEKNVHGRIPENTNTGYFTGVTKRTMREKMIESTVAWMTGRPTTHSNPIDARRYLTKK